MAYVDPRAAAFYGDCSDSMPSSAASEDTLELAETDINLNRIQDAVQLLLRGIGEDASREGLRDTPKVGSVAGLLADEDCHMCSAGGTQAWFLAEGRKGMAGCHRGLQTKHTQACIIPKQLC